MADAQQQHLQPESEPEPASMVKAKSKRRQATRTQATPASPVLPSKATSKRARKVSSSPPPSTSHAGTKTHQPKVSGTGKRHRRATKSPRRSRRAQELVSESSESGSPERGSPPSSSTSGGPEPRVPARPQPDVSLRDVSHVAASSARDTSPGTRRKTLPKFSHDENCVLVQELVSHWPKLFGSMAKRTSMAQKADIWFEICSRVNGVSLQERNIIACKKRLADIRRKIRDKFRAFRRYSMGTGGGPARKQPDLLDYQQHLLSVLHKDSLCGLRARRLDTDAPSGQSETSSGEASPEPHDPPARPRKKAGQKPPEGHSPAGTQEEEEEEACVFVSSEDDGSDDVPQDVDEDMAATCPQEHTAVSSETPLQAAEVDEATGTVVLTLHAVSPVSSPPLSSGPAEAPPRSLPERAVEMIPVFQATQGAMLDHLKTYHEEKLALLRQQVDLQRQQAEHTQQLVDQGRQRVELTQQLVDQGHQLVEVGRQQVALMQHQVDQMKRIRFELRQRDAATRGRGGHGRPSTSAAAAREPEDPANV